MGFVVYCRMGKRDEDLKSEREQQIKFEQLKNKLNSNQNTIKVSNALKKEIYRRIMGKTEK